MSGAIGQAGTAIGGAVRDAGATFGGILKLIFFVKARWTITIILLIWYCWVALNQAMDDGNYYSFVDVVGSKLVSADEGLYWQLKGIESNGWKIQSNRITPDEPEGFWKDTKSALAKTGFIFDLLAHAWFIYTLFYFFYWIIDKFNTSGKVFSVMFAILIMISLQAMYGVSMLYIHSDSSDLPISEKYKNVAFAMTPLKGVTFLVIHSIDIFENAVWKEMAIPLINKSVEQVVNESVGTL